MAYCTARTRELPLTALARSAVAVRCRLSRLGLRGLRRWRRWACRALLWMADGRWRRRGFAHPREPAAPGPRAQRPQPGCSAARARGPRNSPRERPWSARLSLTPERLQGARLRLTRATELRGSALGLCPRRRR